jgi:hypothetical protein
MTKVIEINRFSWSGTASTDAVQTAVPALEAGGVLLLPDLRFDVETPEALLFTPSILSSSKNASYDPSSGRVGGTTAAGADAETLARFIRRFSESAALLVQRLLPAYGNRLVRGRASFRPAEIAGRPTTWRKDDTRLHVDAFPATPSGGRRILRVFSNVNPEGRARSWRLGDDFEAVARRFAPQLRPPFPGVGHLLALARVTKTPRSAYDALMLQLHDRMKADEAFQKDSTQSRVDLPAGSTWLAFTDQVSHAATQGQYQLEQTFLLPVDAMLDADRSPLRILERLKRRKLT